jgi:hypothetical protein
MDRPILEAVAELRRTAAELCAQSARLVAESADARARAAAILAETRAGTPAVPKAGARRGASSRAPL